jgi:hypothetical protein
MHCWDFSFGVGRLWVPSKESDRGERGALELSRHGVFEELVTGEFPGAGKGDKFGDGEDETPREPEGGRSQMFRSKKDELLMTEGTIEGTSLLPDTIEGR